MPSNKNFRRNPNPESSRNKVFSYRRYSGRNPDTSNIAPQENKKTNKISKFLNIVIAICVLSSFVYLSNINTDPVIDIDQKAAPRDESDYYKAVQEEINGSVLYKNKLTFNTDKFSKNIKNRFPEIEDVSIQIPVFRHRPTVNLTLSRPSAKLVTTTKTYILDEKGIALFPEEQISDQFNTSSLISINDASGHPVALGKPVLTEQQINYIREVINQAKANNSEINTLSLEFGGSALDVKFSDTNYIVKFSFYEDPRQSSGAYFTVRDKITEGIVTQPKQYIDLRIPDKAYIK